MRKFTDNPARWRGVPINHLDDPALELAYRRNLAAMIEAQVLSPHMAEYNLTMTRINACMTVEMNNRGLPLASEEMMMIHYQAVEREAERRARNLAGII